MKLTEEGKDEWEGGRCVGVGGWGRGEAGEKKDVEFPLY